MYNISKNAVLIFHLFARYVRLFSLSSYNMWYLLYFLWVVDGVILEFLLRVYGGPHGLQLLPQRSLLLQELGGLLLHLPEH